LFIACVTDVFLNTGRQFPRDASLRQARVVAEVRLEVSVKVAAGLRPAVEPGASSPAESTARNAKSAGHFVSQ